MKRGSLSRRLLAGVAGLTVGLAGAVGLSAPAQATIFPDPVTPSFYDGCDGTTVIVTNDADWQWSWTITVADTLVWPLEEGEALGKGESYSHFVPRDAGTILIGMDQEYPVYRGVEHTWTAATDIDCDELPGPSYTPATCDGLATITIPERPSGTSEPPLTHVPAEGSGSLEYLTFRLNGEVVEPGSTHEVEPGTHEVTAHLDYTADFAEESISYSLHVKTWTIVIEAPDCPGEGGELPKTGTRSVLIAGGALLLLALGGATYLVARPGRVRFTA